MFWVLVEVDGNTFYVNSANIVCIKPGNQYDIIEFLRPIHGYAKGFCKNLNGQATHIQNAIVNLVNYNY